MKPDERCHHCYDGWVGKCKLVDGVCEMCRERIASGLVRYCPSNETEGEMFYNRCDNCRHYIESNYGSCQWGIMDKVVKAEYASDDNDICHWHKSTDMDVSGSPALCLKFTHKNDQDGKLRDPPTSDIPGQMVFGDNNGDNDADIS